jgi:hypothetical protein
MTVGVTVGVAGAGVSDGVRVTVLVAVGTAVAVLTGGWVLVGAAVLVLTGAVDVGSGVNTIGQVVESRNDRMQLSTSPASTVPSLS